MKKITSVLVGAAMSLALAGPSVAAPLNIFLKLTGIQGDSTVAGHVGEISILSYSEGVSRSGGQLRATCGVINLQKSLDSASAPLVADVFTGNVISQGVLSFAEALSGSGLTNLYTLTLGNVVVTSVSQGAAVGGGLPSETVTLRASTVQVAVYSQDPATGAVTLASSITINCATDTVTSP